MIPEAPFIFSIAGLSASLAGLAGLVAGLRRGTDMPAGDLFRLREIVEFAFANVLFSLVVIPLTSWLGSVEVAVRVEAGIAIAYLVSVVLFLRQRQRRLGVPRSRTWYLAAAVINGLATVAAVATLASGSIASFEALLIALLGRPMIAFLLVLESFEPSAG